MKTPLIDHDTVLRAVQQWPREEQLALADEILRSAVAAPDANAAPTGSWRNLIGILATDQPPSDEEVERWLEERRMEKYGG